MTDWTLASAPLLSRRARHILSLDPAPRAGPLLDDQDGCGRVTKASSQPIVVAAIVCANRRSAPAQRGVPAEGGLVRGRCRAGFHKRRRRASMSCMCRIGWQVMCAQPIKFRFVWGDGRRVDATVAEGVCQPGTPASSVVAGWWPGVAEACSPKPGRIVVGRSRGDGSALERVLPVHTVYIVSAIHPAAGPPVDRVGRSRRIAGDA